VIAGSGLCWLILRYRFQRLPEIAERKSVELQYREYASRLEEKKSEISSLRKAFTDFDAEENGLFEQLRTKHRQQVEAERRELTELNNRLAVHQNVLAQEQNQILAEEAQTIGALEAQLQKCISQEEHDLKANAMGLELTLNNIVAERRKSQQSET